MRNKKKVYTVEQDWFYNVEGGSQVDLFETEEKAKAFFEKCVKLEKEEFFASYHIGKDGTVEKGYIIESTEYTFEFYKEGYYDTCHSRVVIATRDIN